MPKVREATLATKKRGNAKVWERKSQLNLSVDILLPLLLLLPNHLLLHQPGQGVPSNGKQSV